MGELDLYNYWSDTFKVHSLEWNRDVAVAILAEWQAKFTQEVSSLVAEKQFDRKYTINSFSSSHLNDILEQFSQVDVPKVVLGYAIMVSYHVHNTLCLHFFCKQTTKTTKNNKRKKT
jgi:patched 1 protein